MMINNAPVGKLGFPVVKGGLYQLLADQTMGKNIPIQWASNGSFIPDLSEKNIIPINLKYKKQSKTSSNNPDSNTHDHTTN